MTEIEERLELAVAIALEAAAIPRRYFRNTGLVIDRKADGSPVTRADKEAEELLRQRIESACPQDAIVGEEFGDRDGTTGFRWYLDPIDGTESFIRGVPLFGTMVALEQGDRAAAGVIVFPGLGEIVYAAVGSGSWWATNADAARKLSELERMEAHVSNVSEIRDAALATTGLAHAFEEAGVSEGYFRLLDRVKLGRGYPDCYGHYLVATGRIDVMIDPLMSVWDNAPLQPIVEEAGGQFTDLRGNSTIHGDSAVSTNGLLHDDVLRAMAG